MPSQIGSRMAFQNAANAVKRAGLNPGNAILSQSYLRFETAMVASSTTYKFDVLVNETSYSPTFGNTTNKLNLQDAFVANQLGVYVACTNGNSTNANEYRLLTYPTIGLASGGAGNFTQALALNMLSLYNGYLSLTVNQRTVIPTWDLMRHYRVQNTQANGATAQFGGTLTAYTAPVHMNGEDSVNLADDGLFPVEPNLVFAGNKKHDLTITLPKGVTALPSVPTNVETRIVIIARGILAQNVTPIN
jgi:hypothetical protein